MSMGPSAKLSNTPMGWAGGRPHQLLAMTGLLDHPHKRKRIQQYYWGLTVANIKAISEEPGMVYHKEKNCWVKELAAEFFS